MGIFQNSTKVGNRTILQGLYKTFAPQEVRAVLTDRSADKLQR